MGRRDQIAILEDQIIDRAYRQIGLERLPARTIIK